MKKIMLLGGSAQQIVAIETAKRLGYKTILCDYLPDNPGQYYADVFYQTSTTDKDAVLELAIEEKIDGIVAYASDPAAPTAAYVAEKMGLPGSPYESVEILCNKDKFRKFLSDNDFCTPKAKGYSDIAEAIKDISDNVFKLPVIVKPVDSSGSKGVVKITIESEAKESIEYAMSFSRGKKIIVEEFVEKKHPYLIGGDIFVLNGKVVMWGLLNCHRDTNVNALVPIGKSYPLQLERGDFENIKTTLQTMVDKLNIKNGAMNVELVVDKNNRVWPIDVGPRNGGNMIPDLLGYIFNVDVVEMTIKCAMGEKVKAGCSLPNAFYATHNLHTDKSGIFEGIDFSKEAEKYIIKKCIYKNIGDYVEYFDNAAKALGVVFFKFENMEEMSKTLENINDLIDINVI